MKTNFAISVLVFLSIFFGGCIDRDYDLNNFDSSISVGDEDSEFDLPLIDFKFPLSALQTCDGEKSVLTMFEEIDVWIPTSYSSIEVDRLISDEAYLNTVISDLLDECTQSEDKLEMVVSLIETNHGEDFRYRLFEEGLPVTDGDLTTQVRYLLQSPYTKVQMQAILSEYAEEYLTSIKYDSILYHISEIGISEDVVDALVDDEDDTSNLYLYGYLKSSFPTDFEVMPVFLNTDINLGILNVLKNRVISIGRTGTDYTINVSREDIRTIIDGDSAILVPIELKKYYPRSFYSSQEFIMSLKLRKTGALTFE